MDRMKNVMSHARYEYFNIAKKDGFIKPLLPTDMNMINVDDILVVLKVSRVAETDNDYVIDDAFICTIKSNIASEKLVVFDNEIDIVDDSSTDTITFDGFIAEVLAGNYVTFLLTDFMLSCDIYKELGQEIEDGTIEMKMTAQSSLQSAYPHHIEFIVNEYSKVIVDVRDDKKGIVFDITGIGYTSPFKAKKIEHDYLDPIFSHIKGNQKIELFYDSDRYLIIESGYSENSTSILPDIRTRIFIDPNEAWKKVIEIITTE